MVFGAKDDSPEGAFGVGGAIREFRRANADSIPIFDKSTLLMNRSLAFFGRQELIKNLCVFYTRGRTRRRRYHEKREI
jgi:hypothetical protein